MQDPYAYIPDGFYTVTPYLFIKDAVKALEFYKHAFGAEEITRLTMPDGKIAYAAIKIGNSKLMLADEFPEINAKSPLSLGGSPVTIYLYVKDVDAFIQQALNAGATLLKPIQDQFFGDRSGGIADPFGHTWHIATHKENVSNEEVARRFKEMFQGG